MNDSKITAQVYQDAQKACSLKVGDWVKVVDKVEEGNPIWRSWCSKNMNSTVGRVGEIKDISPTAIEVYFGDCQFFYPYFVLEKTERPCPFKVGDYVKVARQEPMGDTCVEDKFPGWSSPMDKTLGKVGKITRIDCHSYKKAAWVDILGESRAWVYAWDCLEKVEKPAIDYHLLIDFLEANFMAFAAHCGSETAAATIINTLRAEIGLEPEYYGE